MKRLLPLLALSAATLSCGTFNPEHPRPKVLSAEANLWVECLDNGGLVLHIEGHAYKCHHDDSLGASACSEVFEHVCRRSAYIGNFRPVLPLRQPEAYTRGRETEYLNWHHDPTQPLAISDGLQTHP
jgi:hypothetical protein